MNSLAIIPARCGSKGIKDKNIKELCGKPLIAYTIEAALDSGCFDEVMVSTDSGYYAEIARKCGAKVPFLRSKEMASDTASSWDMVQEVLDGYVSKGHSFNSFCLLQPTSPLRSASDIAEAYRLFHEKSAFAVVSVCEAEHSPLWCGHLPESGELSDFIHPENMIQRQAGSKFYRLNGAIYIVNVERFRSDHYLYQKGSFAFIMTPEHSVDIDTNLDFLFAQTILSMSQGNL